MLPKRITKRNLRQENNLFDGLQNWITSYYKYCEQNPEVRKDEKKHRVVIDKFNGQYLEWLAKTDWGNEESRGLFEDQINYLTQYAVKEEKKVALELLKEQLRSNIKTTIGK